MSIKWENPPKEQPSGGYQLPEPAWLAELMARPGQWGIVEVIDNLPRARNAQHDLSVSGRAWMRPYRFQAKIRATGFGAWKLYVRYMGTK